MKITALDIRQKTFEKSFRGVDKDEVQAFLTTISQQWERMGDENRELRLKLEHAQQDVQKMREVESSLYRTLKTAEDTSSNITEQAQRDADLRIREAQLQSEQLLVEARQRARAVMDEAYQQAEKTVADMQREVNVLGQECQRLEQQFDTLVRDLHHLASDALDKVEKARSRPKGGTAAILSRAARVQIERPKELVANLTLEPTPAMQITTASSVSPAIAVAAAAPAAFVPSAPGRFDEPRERAPETTSYNPKPGQQPDPGAPAQTPGPDIERPAAPAENPGIAPAPHIDEPAPSRVPEPTPPYVQPPTPDIQPVGPSHPEITQPSPATHPSQPGMAAAMPAAEVAVAEKSFFDEI
ncbi:DivIVA domain-containing protein [Hymenobacter terrenus]|uniref:DivIVA domain-containing protein n=1 Tax=Hymenobacter terrenus TaxID=1629124 RepID=UPI000619E742|nr:DivIVA domain-containing protein [Hymenobacter terrenus]